MLTHAHHTGLTVSDLERSVAFYQALGLEIVMQQESERQYLRDILAMPDAHLKMAHLRLPGDGHVLELFEYVSPKGTLMKHRNCDPASAHLCFLVDDLDGTHAGLRPHLEELGGSFVSGPVLVDAGANKGGAALYLRDPDGFTVELFQRAPQAAA
jgi:catechol 2,3-dioxygenase-like lactoylglutathione lyase family enzyme